MKLRLHIWRQAGPTETGRFELHDVDRISPHASFLEMLDTLNQELIGQGGIQIRIALVNQPIESGDVPPRSSVALWAYEVSRRLARDSALNRGGNCWLGNW